MAGVGSALLFRKLRKPEGSIPSTPRLSPEDDFFYDPRTETTNSSRLVDKPVRDSTLNTSTSVSQEFNTDQPVLARTLKGKDEDLICDEERCLKEDIEDRLGKNTWDEDGDWQGRSQGELTDEEFAAYQRWLNNDYPVTQVAPTRSYIIGYTKILPSDSGTREQDERPVAA